MKIKRKNGEVEEVEDGTKLEEGEEEVADEGAETEEEKRLMARLEKSIEKAIATVRENPARQKIFKKEEALEKSVMETDSYRRSKAPFVQLSKKMGEFIDNVKSLAKGVMTKALTEGADADGGFLVPEEFNAEVVRYMSEAAIVRPRARVFNMTRDTLNIPKLDQSTYQFGGVTLYWAEESAEKTESQPTFGKIKLTAKKVIGLCPVSDELLEDSAVNLANFLVNLFGEAIVYEEDYRFLRGTGAGQPLGIITTAGITVVGRNTSAQIRLVDLAGMEAGLPSWADAGAVWITTKAGRAQMVRAGSETTGGVSLWVPSLQEGMPALFMNKPVLLTDKLPALGTKGDIILGNLSYYYIGDRGSLQVASSIHDRFRYDETTFRFVKRVDGQPALPAAFVVLSA